MDFALDDTQRTIAALARDTLTREPEDAAWKALGRAGLLSLAVPERLGGSALGLLETALVLTEVGRAAAFLPALHTLALGVLPIATHGSARQQDELLSHDHAFTAALRSQATVDGGRLSGTMVGVGFADTAHRILFPANDSVFLTDPTDPGVSMIPTPTSSGTPASAATWAAVLTAQHAVSPATIPIFILNMPAPSALLSYQPMLKLKKLTEPSVPRLFQA